MIPKAEPWLNTAQIAAHLGKSVSWVEHAKELPRQKVGGTNRFKVSEVDAWIDAQQIIREFGWFKRLRIRVADWVRGPMP